MKPINKKLARISNILSPLWYVLALFSKNKCLARTLPSEIIVFDFHLIGDIVMLTPLLKALKTSYPNARVVLVAGPWANDILLGTNLVDEIISFSAPWVKYGQGLSGLLACFRLIKQLRKKRWDLGIEVRGDVRQILLLWLTGAARRVGFDFTGGAPLLTDIVFDNGTLAHIGDHHKRICKHLGIWSDKDSYLPFLKLTADEKLKASNIPAFIGFHFGASLPLRRLPSLEIIKLLSMFQSSNVKLLVFSTPGECGFDSLLEQLPQSVRSKVELWSGSLREFIVVVGSALHCYFMDSGPAHISSALAVPTTVFFGPAESNYVRPLGEKIEIVSKLDVQCRPCDQIYCTNKVHQYCMHGLVSMITPLNINLHDFRR